MFFKYLKAVGTGPKGNRDLSLDESQDMMQQILSGKVHPENIAAFLLGWRLKPETIDEFRGALLALDASSRKYDVPNSIELGYSFDGKLKTPYLFPLIAKELQKSELNLCILGDSLQPSKNGITTQEICKDSELVSNIFYFDRKEYLPELHSLTGLRMRSGLRSGLNTLEKLPNITNSQFAITGVHHKPYVKKYNAIFANRYERFALIQGSEGSPELFKKGTLWVNEAGITEEFIVDPEYYGSTSEQDLAKVNAAILLFISKKAKSINEAYELLS
ncbi:MAG: glycosyl transferase [Sulfurimonas sp.]|nr:MAG: glycosyl transferase [Sulfurimonas sp.]PHQ58235.1 MAG: glycosyl transferase [Sulfurimonas sp.]